MQLPRPPSGPGQPSRLGRAASASDSHHQQCTTTSLPGTEHPPPSKTAVGSRLKPADWHKYWDRIDTITVPNHGTFRVYEAGSEGPVLLCIHGGGYSALTWSLVAQHLAKSRSSTHVRVFAPDLRGHGATHTDDDGLMDTTTMIADLAAVWGASSMAADSPPVVLVGHSMGGALAVHAAAAAGRPGGIPNVQGVVVVDVVEGTAMASLPHMMAVLRARPRTFPSLNAAIQWSLRSGMCHNPEAACISVPGMLVEQQGSGGGEGHTGSTSTAGLGSGGLGGGGLGSGGLGSGGLGSGGLGSGGLGSGGLGSGGLGSGGLGSGGLGSGGLVGGYVQGMHDGTQQQQQEQQQKQQHAVGSLGGLPALVEELGEEEQGEQGEQEEQEVEDGGGAGVTRDAAADNGQRCDAQAVRVQPNTQHPTMAPPPAPTSWVWRTPLEQSASYWEGWFSGLSQAFLQLKQPKVLIVAGTDRMDKTLMIGQMQGKFQFVLLPQAGHAVHEDEAARTAQVLLDFIARFRIGLPIVPVPRAAPGVPRVLPVATGPPTNDGTSGGQSTGGWQPSTE